MNGHSQPIEAVAVTAGEAIARPDDPTEDKYRFSGWYIDPDFTERYDFDAPVTADLTLIALWQKTVENWYISDAQPEDDAASAVLRIGGSAPENLMASGTVSLLSDSGEQPEEGAPWISAAADIRSVVVAKGCGAPESMRGWLKDFSALESCDFKELDGSALRDTKDLFSGCAALKTLILSDSFRFHGASGLDSESTWNRGSQLCTVSELESNSPAGGLGGTWERGTVVTATSTAGLTEEPGEAPAEEPVQTETSTARRTLTMAGPMLAAAALPTPTLTLDPATGTTVYPDVQTFTVSSSVAIGELSVSSSDDTVATAALDGSTVTVTPHAAGTVTVTVASAATETVGAGTAEYTAVFLPRSLTVIVPADAEVSYDGQAHTPERVTVTDSVPGLSVTYRDSQNGTYSDTIPSFTAAGSYTVYYRVTADGCHTAEGSYNFTITPKDISRSVSVTFTPAKAENATSEPDMVVKDGDTALVRDTDYTVEFEYNPESSRDSLKYGTAGLSFKGNYTGSYVGEFRQTLFSITYHANWSWYKGSHSGLEVDANGNFARFTGVTVDGVALGSGAYDAESGSTKVTLKPSYLNNLSLTRHTLRIYFEDGYAETDFSIREHLTPTTGDNSNLTLWIILAVVSLAALAAVAVILTNKNRRRRKKRARENRRES